MKGGRRKRTAVTPCWNWTLGCWRDIRFHVNFWCDICLIYIFCSWWELMEQYQKWQVKMHENATAGPHSETLAVWPCEESPQPLLGCGGTWRRLSLREVACVPTCTVLMSLGECHDPRSCVSSVLRWLCSKIKKTACILFSCKNQVSIFAQH